MIDQDELLRTLHMTYPERLQPMMHDDREPTGRVILYIIAAVILLALAALVAIAWGLAG
jgi:hypothetical protein